MVIDLAENRLFLVEGDVVDLASWLTARYPGLRALSLEREPIGTVVVQAAVEPFASVATMLNTGSTGTEFVADAVPGLQGLAPDTLGLGLSGAEIPGFEGAGQTLRVGDATFPIPALLSATGYRRNTAADRSEWTSSAEPSWQSAPTETSPSSGWSRATYGLVDPEASARSEVARW